MEEKKSKINGKPITLAFHLIQFQKQIKEATGDFTLLLTAIQTALKFISSKVRKAGIANLYGVSGTSNVSGDTQKKLDIISNESFLNALKMSNKVCAMVTEEIEDPIILDDIEEANYVVAFDPLDGSSNIDANVTIGSIFSIWKRVSKVKATVEDLLQSGDKIVASGYACYGSSTQLVLSVKGFAVNCYTLDPSLGEFVLTHPDMKIPSRGAIYSINEGNASFWDKPITEYVKSKKFPEKGKKVYSLRYIGSMVGDIHRTLLYGGIFLYPSDSKSPEGKLRLLYEVFPMSFIAENAGGKSTNGKMRILDIIPKNIHQRSSIIIGSIEDVEEVESMYKVHEKSIN